MDNELLYVFSTLNNEEDYISVHKHDCYEIVYYIKGSGTSKVEAKEYEFSPNTFILIEPVSIHDQKHYENTKLICIGFKYDKEFIKLKSGIFNDDHQQSILYYLKQISREISEQKKAFRRKVVLLLQELIIEISRLEEASKRNFDFSYIVRYIEENFNQNMDVEALSKLSGYSYHHFRHLFKQKTGFSPVNYLIHQRVDNAKKLIKESNLSMTEICQYCGFYNESQFSTMFKKIVGSTPSFYRKENK